MPSCLDVEVVQDGRVAAAVDSRPRSGCRYSVAMVEDALLEHNEHRDRDQSQEDLYCEPHGFAWPPLVPRRPHDDLRDRSWDHVALQLLRPSTVFDRIRHVRNARRGSAAF